MCAQPIPLVTDRLILRDFVENDWEAVLAYQQDPSYLRYNEWTSRSAEEVRAFIQMFLEHQKQIPRFKFQFAVTLKSTGELIGNCGIRQEAPESRRADMGYELDPRHWGRGYATESARAVLDFGFSYMNLQHVSAWCIAENVGSARVLEKLGMRLKGRIRERHHFKGKWWDALSYAIQLEEWQAQIKE